MEYARILKIALQNELNIKSEIHVNSNDVEIVSEFNKNIDGIINAIAISFKNATASIGHIDIHANISLNKNSNLNELDINTAISSYDRFLKQFKKE